MGTLRGKVYVATACLPSSSIRLTKATDGLQSRNEITKLSNTEVSIQQEVRGEKKKKEKRHSILKKNLKSSPVYNLLWEFCFCFCFLHCLFCFMGSGKFDFQDLQSTAQPGTLVTSTFSAQSSLVSPIGLLGTPEPSGAHACPRTLVLSLHQQPSSQIFMQVSGYRQLIKETSPELHSLLSCPLSS